MHVEIVLRKIYSWSRQCDQELLTHIEMYELFNNIYIVYIIIIYIIYIYLHCFDLNK